MVFFTYNLHTIQAAKNGLLRTSKLINIIKLINGTKSNFFFIIDTWLASCSNDFLTHTLHRTTIYAFRNIKGSCTADIRNERCHISSKDCKVPFSLTKGLRSKHQTSHCSVYRQYTAKQLTFYISICISYINFTYPHNVCYVTYAVCFSQSTQTDLTHLINPFLLPTNSISQCLEKYILRWPGICAQESRFRRDGYNEYLQIDSSALNLMDRAVLVLNQFICFGKPSHITNTYF